MGTELHQGILGPTFDSETPREAVHHLHQRILPGWLAVMEAHLQEHSYLVGDTVSGADAYLFWGGLLLSKVVPEEVPTPNLNAFMTRMQALETTQTVLERERAAYRAARSS